MSRLPYKVLYALWAALFVLTAALGFLPADDKETQVFLQLMTGVFFIPPWMILLKARNEENLKHKSLIQKLCIASLLCTVVLMVLNMLSANWSEAVGVALNAALVIISAPMACGQGYLMSLFMWGCLLMGSSSRN